MQSLQRSWTIWGFYTCQNVQDFTSLSFYSLCRKITLLNQEGVSFYVEKVIKTAFNLRHGHHGTPGYYKNSASTMNFHTQAANFHTALTGSDSETSIHQPMHCGPAQEPCQYIHAKHVTSGQLLSGIPAAYTILRLRCHFCPLCFLSCSEQRL